jgi:divalent metal cation (Fe/Co/Zn/Cd) transporter
VRARWLGHRLTAELDIAVDGGTTVQQAEAILGRIQHELLEHVPALSTAHLRARPVVPARDARANNDQHAHTHAEHVHGDN